VAERSAAPERGAPREGERLSVGGELPEALSEAVRDGDEEIGVVEVFVAGGDRGERERPRETRPAQLGAERFHERAVRPENGDPVVAGVGHVEQSPAQRRPGRTVERSRLGTRDLLDPHELVVDVAQVRDAVVSGVRHVEISRRVPREGERVAESRFARSFPAEDADRRQALVVDDVVIAAVHPVHGELVVVAGIIGFVLARELDAEKAFRLVELFAVTGIDVEVKLRHLVESETVRPGGRDERRAGPLPRSPEGKHGDDEREEDRNAVSVHRSAASRSPALP
jgi:hypothetical protein